MVSTPKHISNHVWGCLNILNMDGGWELMKLGQTNPVIFTYET